MANKEGVVKVVSKTGGILFTDDEATWYNASTKELSAETATRWKELKAHKVVMSLNDKGRFTSVELADKATSAAPIVRGLFDTKTSIRQTAANAAAVIVASFPPPKTGEAGKLDLWKITASTIEEWITRDDGEPVNEPIEEAEE